MAAFTDLAVETRLQIFEYLLHSRRPLKRVTRKAPGANNTRLLHEQKTTRLFRKVNATAILFVSRSIHAEAIAVFYTLNTIRIRHEDICLWTINCWPVGCDRDLLQHAILDDASIWTPFSNCGSCGENLFEVIETLRGENFPRLKDITINVKGIDCVNELRRQLCRPIDEEGTPLDKDTETDDQAQDIERDLQNVLYGRDMELECFGVGRFRVTGADPMPTIIFQYPDLVQVWDYYEALQLTHADLLHHAPVPKALSRNPADLVSLLHHFFNDRTLALLHAMHCEFAREHEHDMGVGFGNTFISVAELKSEEGLGRVYEAITRTTLDKMSNW
ncbi:hypothetical protein B0A55_00797 [Friedmanniomyces simplex]|uniref:Uncharacterized protein n=1 Tax=Friedmanniomyces simplex TaxID=329884 RepID=A0A4U0XYZ6_9PEZI|nr:hypothetical protein B0A55_00797 [Friedmanniomyces simplex]